MPSTDSDVHTFIWCFQFCSFLVPISDHGFTLKNVMYWLWSCMHFGLIVLELAIVYLFRNRLFHSGSTIGKIVDVFQVTLPITAHLVLILETMFNWNHQFEMWQTMKSIEKRTEQIGLKRKNFLKAYLIEISTLALVGMVTEAIIITSIVEDENFARSWYVRVYSLYMIRFGLMQLIFYFEWMGCYINVITMALLNVEANGQSKVKLLNELKTLYSDIWLFSVTLNKRFSWSILVLMVHLFITIICAFYYVVTRFYFHEYSLLGTSSIICISPITNLLVLLYACQQCLNQVPFQQTNPNLQNKIINLHSIPGGSRRIFVTQECRRCRRQSKYK